MEFLNTVLLVGMAAAALPVIIHLLNRRRARMIDWGAMRFLELSLASRGRRVMLEEILLLALRTALLAVLVTAMARPLLVNRNFAGPGAAGQDVVVLLDGSMSMGVAPPGAAAEKGNYFERAKRAAAQAIDRLSPGDSVAVVLAGPAPRRLTAGLTFDREWAKRAVAEAGLTEGVMDVSGSLLAAGKVLEGGKNAHKQVVVVTDGRAHGWRTESASAWQALANKLAGGSFAARPPRVQVLGLAWGQEQGGAETGGGEPLMNLAIESVRLSRPVIGTDLPVVLTAVVRNTGGVASPAGVRLSLRPGPGAEPIDGQSLPELAPMASTTAQLQAHFAQPGAYRLVFDLDVNDALAADNKLVYAVEVLRSLPVLLVNGEPNAAADQDECFWLRAAFQPAAPTGGLRGISRTGKPEAGVEPGLSVPIEFLVNPTTVELPLLRQEDLSRYYAVVLANVPRLGAEELARLKQYVRGGGGLLVAPGAKSELAFYNGAMFEDGRGLLPGRLGEPADVKVASLGASVADAEPVRSNPPEPQADDAKTQAGADDAQMVMLSPPAQGHPALIGAAEPTLWGPIRVFRRFPLAPAEGSEVATVLKLNLGASAADPLAAGEPYALDRPFGQGRVVLLGGPLDTAWSNAPLHNGYVILVNELMYYLSAPRRTALNLAAGEMLVAPAPAELPGAAAQVRTPDGRSFELTRVMEGGEGAGGRWVFKFGQTAEPGVYELRFTGGTALNSKPDAAALGGASSDAGRRAKVEGRTGARSETGTSQPDENVLYFTVQRDPGESFMALLDESARGQVSRWLAGVNFHSDPAALAEALRVTDPGREIWKLLAAAVLAMLLLEVWLTRRITRHRHGRLDSGVTFGDRPVHTVR